MKEDILEQFKKLQEENKQLREALKKCIPLNIYRNTCIFCGKAFKYHTEDCEYIKLTEGEE